MNTFGDIRARFSRILENGLNEEVERADTAGLIKYLKDLEGVPREDTIFKVNGKIIPKPEIDKLINKEGITFSEEDKDTVDVLNQEDLAKKLKGKIESTTNHYKKIAFEKDDKEAFIKSFDKLLAGEKISKEDAELVAKYAKVGTTPGGKVLKIYFANSTPGEFRQGARQKAMTKGDAGGTLQKSLISNGMETTPAVTVGGGVKPKIGPKEINPNKLIGKTRDLKITSEKDKDGNITEVTIDGKVLKRITQPSEEALFEMVNEATKNQNKDLTDDQVKSQVQRTRRAIDRRNDQLAKYVNMKPMQLLDPVDGLEGLNQKDRSQKIQEDFPKLISSKMREMIGENPTEAEKDILKAIEDMSKIESQEDFDKAIVDILREMDDIESIKKGSSDLAESFTYMSLNKRGLRTELPAGENFPVADVISLGGDMEDLDPNDPDYASKIAMQGLGLVVNLEMEGGISVKKDGGAASAAKAKIGESEFKNKETADKLYELIDNHNSFLGLISDPTTDKTIEKGDKKLDDVQNWAVDSGIMTKEEIDNLNYNGRTPKQWAKDTLEKWNRDDNGPFAPVTLKALEQHAKQALLLAEIHNRELTEQSYGNINVSTSKKDPGIHVTDGITNASLMSPSLNPGFSFTKGEDGFMIPRPNAVYTANLSSADYNAKEERFVINK